MLFYGYLCETATAPNDSSYMYEIKNHLVAMAETVFIVQQQNTTESERELTLDDNELVKVMQTEND